jgi:hypothetical protein
MITAPLSRIEAADIAARPPVDHLDLEGNLIAWIADVMANRLALGPSHLAEHCWPVSVEYDPATGCSRVGVSYLPPSNVAAA